MIRRGEVRWASLPPPTGSGPGYRRPVLIIQSDPFNRSAIRTVVCVVLTSNLRRADAPGNVRVARRDAGLRRDSVANVSQILTLDRDLVDGDAVRLLPPPVMRRVDEGLRLVLGLD